MYFSKEEAWRIGTLSPQFAHAQALSSTSSTICKIMPNKSRDRASGLDYDKSYPITLKNMSKIKIFNNLDLGPPRKRSKLSFVEVIGAPATPPMPRLNSPMSFFMSTVDPNTNGLLDDSDFMDYIGQRSHQYQNNMKKSRPLAISGSLVKDKQKLQLTITWSI